MASSSSLPSEVLDYIINYLYDDASALLVCSTLGRRWLPSSRHHLFSTLSLTLTYSTLTRLVDLLNHPSNTITRHVERLSLNALSSAMHYFPIDDLVHAVAVLPRLADALPFASCLRMSECVFEDMPDELLVSIKQALAPRFRRLELHSVCFDSMRKFSSFVRAFKNAEEISLKWVTLGGGDSRALALKKVKGPRREASWEIDGLHMDDNLSTLAAWLTSSSQSSHVTSLYYNVQGPGGATMLRNVVGPALVHLCVEIPIYLDFDSLQRILPNLIDLRPCTGLRTLRIGQIPLRGDDVLRTLHVRSIVPKLLEQISSPSLLQLNLQFVLAMFSDTPQNWTYLGADWEGISSACSKVSSLKSIVLEFGPGQVNLGQEECEKSLREGPMGQFGEKLQVDFRKACII